MLQNFNESVDEVMFKKVLDGYLVLTKKPEGVQISYIYESDRDMMEDIENGCFGEG